MHATEDWAIDLHLFWIAVQLSHFADEFANCASLTLEICDTITRARACFYTPAAPARAGKDNDVMQVTFCLAC